MINLLLAVVGTVLLGLQTLRVPGFNTEQRTLGIDSVSFSTELTKNENSKSILIVGAGSGGLAALKALLDLPFDARANWSISLYEQRQNVGGIWLPDLNDPKPPEPPETPLYPGLLTNIPHPTMTHQGFPFPPLTPLFPSHEYVEQYHVDYANHYNLFPYIRFNMTVLSAAWIGNSTTGKWNVTALNKDLNSTSYMIFDHIISATGNNRYPRTPSWKGQNEWLEAKQGREIMHTMFWRTGTKYEGKTILLVGRGASAQDVALQTAPYANKVYLSLRSGTLPPRIKQKVIQKPAISHFTENRIVFTDGTELGDVDTVILGTGYEVRVPYLIKSGALRLSRGMNFTDSHDDEHSPPAHLTTNLRYIRPLHEHIFPLSSSFPLRALAFIGLPSMAPTTPMCAAQSLLVAHALANASLLPSQDDMLAQLHRREAYLRARGFNPFVVGHRLINPGLREGNSTPETQQHDLSNDYQDALVAFLKARGALPDDGRPFVQAWRREGREHREQLRDAWEQIERRGEREVEKWLRGVSTENEWADLMLRLIEWEKEKKREM